MKNDPFLSGRYTLSLFQLLGRCALKMALDSKFTEAVKLFLATPGINIGNIDTFVTQAYQAKQNDIVQTILSSSHSINLDKLLLAAIKNEDINLTSKLLSEKKAEVNQITFLTLPLIEAIKSNYLPMVKNLLEHGADLFINTGGLLERTPLMLAFSPDSHCVECVISYLQDINQLDSTGKAAIHHAVILANADALKQLIEKGANIKLRTSNGNNVFDCLSRSLLFDESQITACLKLLIANYDFSLSDSSDKNILKDLLLKNIDNDELYNLIISKCDKELINGILINGRPLLHHFMVNRQFHRIESLLEKGAFVDKTFSNGNTPLMAFIKVKDLPEKYAMISLLIKYKSDLTIKNKEGKTAIDLVIESGDEKLKQIFYDQGLMPTSAKIIKMG